jgi:O-antigen/teichoic acid export membrane protein
MTRFTCGGPPAQSPEKSSMRKLTDRTLGAVFWTVSGTGISALLQALVLIVLTRLLTPFDFGVAGAAIVVLKLAQILTRIGILQAIVQRSDIQERHLRTAFTVSCLMGIIVAVVVALSAPLMASFFRMHELRRIIPVISLSLPFWAAATVAESLLQREIKFSRIAGMDAASFVGYGAVGLTLAFLHYGFWSLVWAQIAQATMRSVSLMVAQPHPKRPLIERKAFTEVMYYGTGQTLSSLLNNVAGQADRMVIGRWLGAEALGIYSRAYQLMAMPANLFGLAVDSILFSTLSKIQDRQDKLRSAYKKGVAMIALIILPVSAMMYVLAPEVILFLFGKEWIQAVSPFRILALGMLFRTSYKMSDILTKAVGAIYNRAMRYGIFAALVFGGAWAGSRWGLDGVCYGILVAIFLNFILMANLSLQLVPSMKWRDIIYAHLPAVLLTSIVLGEVIGVAELLRSLSMPVAVTLFIPGVVVLITVFLLVRTIPDRVLGEEGVRVMETLSTYVSDRWSKRRSSRCKAGVQPSDL